MSQPQNLRADDLQHSVQLTPTDAEPVLVPVPDLVPGTDEADTVASVAQPRLRSVDGGTGKHTVPASARYATELTDGALALRLQAITRLGVASPATGPVTEQAAGHPDGVQPPHDTTTPRVPEARAWGGRLAQAVAEVLAGDRPISQLVRFTDDAVFMELNRRVRLMGLNTTAVSRGAKDKSTLRSVRVFMPEPFVAEVSAHVRRGDRSRAIALRMEIRRNRWVCTALELG
jgi:hypothetical protein